MTRRHRNHLGALEMSIGTPTGVFENIGAAFEVARRTDSAFGLEVDYQNKLGEALAAASGATGTEYKFDANIPELVTILDRELGQKPSLWSLRDAKRPEAYEKFDLLQKQMEEAKKLNPNIKTPKEVFNDLLLERKKLISEQELIAARQNGWMAWLGEMGGYMGGAFDPQRDPINFGSLFLGIGAGRTLLTKILGEMAIGAGSEAISQLVFVNKRKQALGEPTHPIASILYAGLGAGVFRGAFEVVPPLARGAYREAEARFFPNRERNQIIREIFGKEPELGPIAVPTEETLARAVDELAPNSYERDAAITLAELDAHFVQRAGIEDTAAGRAALQGILEQEYKSLEGLIPSETIPVQYAEATPAGASFASMQEIRDIELAAKKVDAELGDRIAELRDDLEGLQALNRSFENIENTQTLQDALESYDLITPEVRDQIDQIDSAIAKTEPNSAERQGLELQRDELIQDIPQEKLEQAQQAFTRDLDVSRSRVREREDALKQQIKALADQAGVGDLDNRIRQLGPSLEQGPLAHLDEFFARGPDERPFEERVAEKIEGSEKALDADEITVDTVTNADMVKMFGNDRGRILESQFDNWWRSTISVGLLRGDDITVTLNGRQVKIVKLSDEHAFGRPVEEGPDAPLSQWQKENRDTIISNLSGHIPNIRKLHAEGKTAKEIAAVIGIDENEVRILRESAGLEPLGPAGSVAMNLGQPGKGVGKLTPVPAKAVMNDPNSVVEVRRTGAIGKTMPVADTMPKTITMPMRKDLEALGMSKTEIDNMTVEDAWATLHRVDNAGVPPGKTLELGFLDRPITRDLEIADGDTITNAGRLMREVFEDDAALKQALICSGQKKG